VMGEVLMTLIGVLSAALYQMSPTMMILGVAPALILRRTLRLPMLRAESEQRGRALEHERERVAELEELERLRDVFIATVTHDLRSPLTSIVGYAEMLREGEFGVIVDDQRRALKVIERNSGHLLTLVEDLLLVSRPDGETLVFSPEPVDLRELALEAAEAARPLAAEGKVAISCVLPVRLPMLGDERRLVQVVTNLLSNAIKYTLPGGSVTFIGSVEGGRIRLAVTDTGIGLSAADRAKLFTRFFRSSTALDLRIPGTGLGLVVIKTIVDAHRGTVDVISEEGIGTTFSLGFAAAEAPMPVVSSEVAA
jgi:signal transduction histidine kinase